MLGSVTGSMVSVMNVSLRRTNYEYSIVSLFCSVVSFLATRWILGDSGINLSSVGLLVMSALFSWRGYAEPK
jgi:hypothetical protein